MLSKTSSSKDCSSRLCTAILYWQDNAPGPTFPWCFYLGQLLMSKHPSYLIVGTGVLCPLLCMSAGAVYLKNCMFKYWKPHDPSDVGDELPPYSIPEQAKSLIRDNIVGAIIRTPLLIRCVPWYTLLSSYK